MLARHQAVSFATDQGAVMLCDWEVIALAVRHRHGGVSPIHYGLEAFGRQIDSTPNTLQYKYSFFALTL